jgi:hypothetical protein
MRAQRVGGAIDFTALGAGAGVCGADSHHVQTASRNCEQNEGENVSRCIV